MRSLLFISVFITLLSCSQEGADIQQPTTEASAMRMSKDSPSNAVNPYESSGHLFDALFDLYYSGDSLAATTEDIVARVELLAASHPEFLSMQSLTYEQVSPVKIDYLLSNPASCVNDMLQSSQLSGRGRERLKDFINTVVPLCSSSTEYDPIYDYIADFEDATLGDSLLTDKDKQVILTTASITRYSAYKARKKPKKRNDPEWDMLITHVTAGAEGADRGGCEAVTMALSAGIAGN